MSVDGSIDTVALLDLLSLLATTRKSGRLRVSGDRLSGHVWLLDGDLIASGAGRARTDLEAVFQLLRLTSGRFSFDTEVAIPTPVRRVPLLGLLDDAVGRLAEWADIELAVPSMTSVVKLMPELRGSEAMVGADQWRVIAAVGQASGVIDILDGLDLEDFEGCRVIKELVDSGFVRVEEPEGPHAEQPIAALVEDRATAPEMTGDPASDHPGVLDARPVFGASVEPAAAPDLDDEPVRSRSLDLIKAPFASADVGLASDRLSTAANVSPPMGAEVASSSTHLDGELDDHLSRGTLLKFLSSMRA